MAARLGISETGFRCRMATALMAVHKRFCVNLYGRNDFRKQPEPVNVTEIVRELTKSDRNRHRFGGVILA
jgi:hypothetical protein